VPNGGDGGEPNAPLPFMSRGPPVREHKLQRRREASAGPSGTL